MGRRLILIDKDGTLVGTKSGTFVQGPADQEPLPGVVERLTEVDAAATLVVVSNQGGVAAGHKSLEATIAEIRYCLDLFPRIKAALFCPDFEGKSLWIVERGFHREIGEGLFQYQGTFRKPGAGMLQAAQIWEKMPADLMIGDRPEDATAAFAAGVPFLDAITWRTGGLPKD